MTLEKGNYIKNPDIDHEEIERVLDLLPRNIPLIDILCAYTVLVLKRNLGSRVSSAKELRMPIKTFRFRFGSMESLGYEIPEYKYGRKKKRPADKSLDPTF